MKRTRLSLYLVALVLIISSLAAPDAGALPLTDDDRLEDRGISAPNFFAELQDVELVGSRAYVFGVGGLIIYDVSIPASPVTTDMLTAGLINAWDVALAGDFAYIADGLGGDWDLLALIEVILAEGEVANEVVNWSGLKAIYR